MSRRPSFVIMLASYLIALLQSILLTYLRLAAGGWRLAQKLKHPLELDISDKTAGIEENLLIGLKFVHPGGEHDENCDNLSDGH
ncbi:hypothetical protein CA267_010505 [Alteromonas pelagimontana]|uniref:Uncharacterized protein n=1 Tax=Alteromonas pelagimontana TaxID=1858656 RepID=A0A6M4MDK4_9ALTE|nr:hypothetical protein [Alteromonas pelagimontana]QJR81179.1 hypothetical protein CA267_010505 [Alteromonas pelagimontana]